MRFLSHVWRDKRFEIMIDFSLKVMNGCLEIDQRAERRTAKAAGRGHDEAIDGTQPSSAARSIRCCRYACKAGEVRWRSGCDGRSSAMVVEPDPDLRVLVGIADRGRRSRAEDHADNLASRHGSLDRAQEADELLMSVLLHTAAEERATEDVERSSGAMGRGSTRRRNVRKANRTHVGVCLGPGTAGHWVAGQASAAFGRRQIIRSQWMMGAGQGPDLRPLIHRQYDRAPRQRQVEPNDIRELGREVGVAAVLGAAHAVWHESVSGSDSLHGPQRKPGRSGQHRPRPMQHLAGQPAGGQRHQQMHGCLRGVSHTRLSGPVAKEAIDAGVGEAKLSMPYRRPAAPDAPGYLRYLEPFDRAQDDPCPRHMLLRLVAIRQDCRRTLTIVRQNEEIGVAPGNWIRGLRRLGTG